MDAGIIAYTQDWRGQPHSTDPSQTRLRFQLRLPSLVMKEIPEGLKNSAYSTHGSVLYRVQYPRSSEHPTITGSESDHGVSVVPPMTEIDSFILTFVGRPTKAYLSPFVLHMVMIL